MRSVHLACAVSAAARAVATRLFGTYPKPAIWCAGRRRYAGPASWGGRQGARSL